LDVRVVAARQRMLRRARRPVRAAEPRAGEADRRSRGDDEDEDTDGREGDAPEDGRRHRPREPARHRGRCGPRVHESSVEGFSRSYGSRTTPEPFSTEPTRARKRPARSNSAPSESAFSAGSVTRSPPAVWASYARASSSSGTPSLET